MKDVWEKVTKIDMSGHGDVVVCMPYNFIIPQFLSDADYLSESSKNTTNTLMMERMVNLEKKVEEKNSEMMSMLQSINSKIGNTPVGSQPTFTQSYAICFSKSLDPDPHRDKRPDPHQMYADP